MKSLLSPWLALTRLDHGIMSAAGALIGIMIMQKESGIAIGAQQFAFALLVPVFVQVAAFALNDLLDIETDRHNKRKDRPLANGEIGEGAAKITVVAGFALGVSFAFMINPVAGAIAAVFSALSIAYDYKLKDLPLLGNIYIAISMAIAFVFGAVVVKPESVRVFGAAAGNSGAWALPDAIVIVCIIAFFAGLGREIIKSAQDMEGDREKRGAKTLPIMIGRKNALIVAAMAYVVFAIGAIWLLYSYALPFMVLSAGLVAISTFAFLAMAWEIVVAKELGQERLAAFRKTSLYALMAGLLGILIASM